MCKCVNVSQTCSQKPKKARVVVIVLTFIIGKLEVVIHRGDKLLHKEASNAGCQVLLAVYLTFQHITVEIWGRQGGESNNNNNKTYYFFYLNRAEL